MDSKEKRNLSNLKNVNKFQLCIKKITIHEDLSEEEKQFILECAIMLIKEYEINKEYESYLELAYFIILNYSLQYNDYQPLYDFSINFGYYPIAKNIVEHKLIELKTIEDVIWEKKMNRYEKKDIVETYEQFNTENNILKDKNNNYITYIAPTSYGKSSIINELIVNDSYNKIGIIVPTKSLINQTYRKLKNQGLDYKIIIHDEMYDGEEKFIGVLTQERALRLLEREDFYFEKIYIDEAHNILDDDYRSILLTRLIKKNKVKNANQKIVYLSPVINNSKSLELKDNEDEVKEYKVRFNIKEPEIYELTLEGTERKYNRFLNEFYVCAEYKELYSYIVDKAKEKNFIFISRPINIERFSKELYTRHEIEEININRKIEEVIEMLKKYVHENFYVIKLLKKGIVYIHGKMPDSIKDYLEYKFKTIDELKYIIANHVILEGMNLPIDTLFILTTNFLSHEQLVNLIGRVNRLNEIFTKNVNNLKKLSPKVYFINSETYNKKNSNMANKIGTLRSYMVKDNIKNPLMENYDINKLEIKKEDREKKKIKNEIIIKNEMKTLKSPQNEDEQIEKIIIESGLSNYYQNVSDIIKSIKYYKNNIQAKNIWAEKNMIDKIYDVFIKENEDIISNFEIKRLKNIEARDYYKNYIEYSKRNLKERIKQQYDYFLEIKDNPVKNQFYIGKSYGELSKITDDYTEKHEKVYVDLSKKDNESILNLAVAKIKIEDDFISFKINSFVNVLFKVELINEDEYNEFVYGTTDRKKLQLIKRGLSISIVNRLSDENQIENIEVDKNNNISANKDLKLYINKLDDYEKFEIEKYL